MRVLFLQQQPCVRALKYAVGLAGCVELGFAYRGRTLSELYGAGDELFEAWYPLGEDPEAAVLREGGFRARRPGPERPAERRVPRAAPPPAGADYGVRTTR